MCSFFIKLNLHHYMAIIETHKSARKKRQIITRKNPIFEIVRVIASEIYAQKTEIKSSP